MFGWTKGLAGLWLLWATSAVLAAPLPLHHYSTSNGLVHNHVNSLYSDAQGFLWICTDEGLARFDGQQFKTYTRQNGIPHIHVNAIVETRDGEHWIATDSGVARFHPRGSGPQFESFALGSVIEAQFVNTLAEDRDGSLLAGTNRGLFRIVREKSIHIEPVPVAIDRYPGVPSIHHVLIGSGGEWWLGCDDGLLGRTRDGKWLWLTKEHGLPSDWVGIIGVDANGRLWVGTKAGAARLRPGVDGSGKAFDLVVTERSGLPHPDVRALYFARGGIAWIGTMNGLAECDSESGRVLRSYHREDGLVDESIYSIAADLAGNVWFGTRRGGLLELRSSEIRTYGAAAGLTSSGDDVLVETAAGEICVASIGDSRRPLQCFESERFVRAAPKLPPGFAAAQVTSSQATLQDRTGAWWISTPNGLLRFLSPSGRMLANRSPDLWLLRGVECRRLLEDAAGNIWVETKRANLSDLAKWDARQKRIIDLSFRLPERARAASISALADDGRAIWLGMGRPGGLFRLSDDRCEEIPGIPRGTVNALHRDRRGHLWVATSDEGVAEVDVAGGRPVIHVYKAGSRLSSNEVWSFAEDQRGNIYAGTARGVDRIDPVTTSVIQYSAEDGLAQGDIRSALCDRHGNLWFLSNQGLSRLCLTAGPPAPPPIARISEFRAGGKRELVSEFGEIRVGPLRLQPDQSSVDIDFLAVSHRAPWRTRYQYRLEGAEGAAWSEPSAASLVRFPNLAPGAYRFQVRAIGESGQPGAASIAEFRLLPPFWQRAWFMAALLVLTVAAGYAAHLYRLNHLLAVERVRTRLASDLHDDLGAGLAEIAILSEVARRNVADRGAEALEYTANRARSLRAALGDIVWTVDPSRDHLPDLIRRMRETALAMLEADDRKVLFVAPPEEEIARVELDPDLRRHVFLIFKEAVTNVARHSGATDIHVEVLAGSGVLRMTIRDNGQGFDPKVAVSGQGLMSLRYRASELRGELRLESTPGVGTEVELRVPLRR